MKSIFIFLIITIFAVSCNQVPQRAGFIDGAPNFRDLGGYPGQDGQQTVWRKLFRSQTLAQLTDSDLDKLHDLGIKTVIDFRDDEEVMKAPSRLPESVNIIRLPIGVGRNDSTISIIQQMMSGDADSLQCMAFMEQANRSFVKEFTPQYKKFFSILLRRDSYPVVFHCTAGKDRTGFAAALVLTALGTDWDVVLQDYLLTNEYLKAPVDTQLPAQAIPAMRQLWGVKASYLNAAKDEIVGQYGSVDQYLEQELGVGAAEKELLRTYLLD